MTETAAWERTFAKWAAAYVAGELALIPGLGWLALPVISAMLMVILERVTMILAGSFVLHAMFEAQVQVKTEQAKAYSLAVSAKKKAATKDEYARAEKAEMAAFCSLVAGHH